MTASAGSRGRRRRRPAARRGGRAARRSAPGTPSRRPRRDDRGAASSNRVSPMEVANSGVVLEPCLPGVGGEAVEVVGWRPGRSWAAILSGAGQAVPGQRRQGPTSTAFRRPDRRADAVRDRPRASARSPRRGPSSIPRTRGRPPSRPRGRAARRSPRAPPARAARGCRGSRGPCRRCRARSPGTSRDTAAGSTTSGPPPAYPSAAAEGPALRRRSSAKPQHRARHVGRVEEREVQVRVEHDGRRIGHAVAGAEPDRAGARDDVGVGDEVALARRGTRSRSPACRRPGSRRAPWLSTASPAMR